MVKVIIVPFDKTLTSMNCRSVQLPNNCKFWYKNGKSPVNAIIIIILFGTLDTHYTIG